MDLIKVNQAENVASVPDRTEDEKRIQETITDLERRLTNVTVELSKLMSDITSMEIELQKSFPEKMKMIEELNQELLSLLTKGQRGQTETGEGENEKKNGHKQHRQFRENSSSQSTVRNKDSAVKKLYKQIAQRTHPDRTKHKSEKERKILEELFLEARAAYESNDLQGLKEVWACVSLVRPRLLNQLITRMHQLIAEITRSESDLIKLKLSPPYLMLKDYEILAYRPRVVQHYEQLLTAKLHELRSRIHSLDPSRYS